MKQRTLLLGTLTMILSACGGLPKPGPAPALYDFGIPSTSMATPIPVKLTRVEAVPGLESFDMRYRLAYQNPTRVFTYNETRWAAAPADLLAQRLRQQGFAHSSSPCSLRITLETFDQIFDSPSSSHAMVGLRAVLINGIGRDSQSRNTRIMAESPASSADARGGVVALTAATDDAIGKLVTWVNQQQCETKP